MTDQDKTPTPESAQPTEAAPQAAAEPAGKPHPSQHLERLLGELRASLEKEGIGAYKRWGLPLFHNFADAEAVEQREKLGFETQGRARSLQPRLPAGLARRFRRRRQGVRQSGQARRDGWPRRSIITRWPWSLPASTADARKAWNQYVEQFADGEDVAEVREHLSPWLEVEPRRERRPARAAPWFFPTHSVIPIVYDPFSTALVCLCCVAALPAAPPGRASLTSFRLARRPEQTSRSRSAWTPPVRPSHLRRRLAQIFLPRLLTATERSARRSQVRHQDRHRRLLRPPRLLSRPARPAPGVLHARRCPRRDGRRPQEPDRPGHTDQLPETRPGRRRHGRVRIVIDPATAASPATRNTTWAPRPPAGSAVARFTRKRSRWPSPGGWPRSSTARRTWKRSSPAPTTPTSRCRAASRSPSRPRATCSSAFTATPTTRAARRPAASRSTTSATERRRSTATCSNSKTKSTCTARPPAARTSAKSCVRWTATARRAPGPEQPLLAQLIGEEFRLYGLSRDDYRGVKSMPFRVTGAVFHAAVLAEVLLPRHADEAALARPAARPGTDCGLCF